MTCASPDARNSRESRTGLREKPCWFWDRDVGCFTHSAPDTRIPRPSPKVSSQSPELHSCAETGSATTRSSKPRSGLGSGSVRTKTRKDPMTERFGLLSHWTSLQPEKPLLSFMLGTAALSIDTKVVTSRDEPRLSGDHVRPSLPERGGISW